MLLQFPITNAAPDVLSLVKFESQDKAMPSRKKVKLSDFLPHDPLAEPALSSEKGEQQVLCKTQTSPSFGFVNSSLTISQSADFGLFCQKSSSPIVVNTALWPKNPLRLVVARAPQFAEDIHSGTLSLYAYLDTLECGHQVWHGIQYVSPEIGKLTEAALPKRHRCVECKGLSDAKKKPQSVKAKKRRVA